MRKVVTVMSTLDLDNLDTTAHDEKIAKAARGMAITGVDVQLFPGTTRDRGTIGGVPALNIRTTVTLERSPTPLQNKGRKICTVVDELTPELDLSRHNHRVNSVPGLIKTSTAQLPMSVLKMGKASVYPAVVLYIATTVIHR